MFTKAFWKAATERAIKTAAQTILTAFFVGDVLLDVFQTDWLSVAGIGLGGAFFSYLTSLGSNGLNEGNGPSLSNESVG